MTHFLAQTEPDWPKYWTQKFFAIASPVASPVIITFFCLHIILNTTCFSVVCHSCDVSIVYVVSLFSFSFNNMTINQSIRSNAKNKTDVCSVWCFLMSSTLNCTLRTGPVFWQIWKCVIACYLHYIRLL